MKKVFKSILVTVAAALAFASCQRESDVNGTEGRTVRFLAGPVETRTAFSTPDATGQYPVVWTENDTKVKVSLGMGSAVDATVTPNGATAEFEASVKTDEVTAPYTFYALSPATAYFSISGQYMDWGIAIPSDQNPSAGTPDEAAQVLAGVSSAATSLDEVIELNFSHVTAYGRMTLTGLDLTGVAVTGVSLTAAQPLTGRFYYYVADTDEHEAGELVAQSASNTLNIGTSSLEDIWFACAPADLSGTDLKITVYTADGPYEKTITLPANRKFQAGRIAKFTINMSGAELQENKVYELVTDAAELTAGSEVIIANAAGDHAISTTQTTNNRAATAVTVEDDKIVNPSDLVEILAVEAGTAAGTFAFKTSGGLYLTATGSSANQLRSNEEKTAAGSFKVSIDAEGVTTVNAESSGRGNMRYNENSGNPIFNCYATTSTAGTPVALYKLVGSGSDEEVFQATLEGANESGLLTVPASATSAVINVISNVDWVIYSDDDVEFSQEDGNSSASVEVTFPANETEEPVTYTINIESDLGEYEFVITQEAFVPAGESVYRKVTSVSAGKKYILAAYVGGKLLAVTPIAADKTYGYPVGTEVSSTDGVIDTRHADLELTFASVTGGYSIAQPDARYWAMTGTYNSINVYDSAQESYVWTVTANQDGTVDIANADKGKHIMYDGSHSNFAVYASFGDKNTWPALYEYIDGGDTPVDPPVGENGWFKKDITAITSSDVFVIVGNNGNDYAMSNDNGTSAAPAAVAVSVASDGKSLTAAPAANLQWKLTASGGAYTFYPNGVTDKYLYITNSNNGVRVGTGEQNTFTISSEGYLYNAGLTRYMGIYNSQDWRTYTSINANIKDQTFAFFVKSGNGGGDTPVVETVATPTFSPAAGEVEAGTAVTISCATSGATIHYMTDGSTPTASSATGTSVTVNAAMTIKAIAVKDGMNDSEVASAAYTIKSTTPPSGDSYVKVSSITSGKKYIIVGGTTSKALAPAAGRPAAVDVTVSDNKIASTTATDALAVTINKSGDVCQIVFGDKYVEWAGSGTELKLNATASDSWTASTVSANGSFRFTATASMSASTVRALVYRAGTSNVFGAYSINNVNGSEYYDIDLYELGGEGGSVTPAVPATVTFTSGTSKSMTAGETFSNPATTNSTATVTYSSSNTAVATVNAAGLITAVAAGTAVITASVAAVEGAFTAGQATCNITVTSAPTGDEVIDLLTASDFSATNTTYTDFSGVTKNSDAVYAGNTAKSSAGDIQIRSNNSNAGIVSTQSGGNVKKVNISFDDSTVNEREISVYGSNTAYTAASDLYGSAAGTELGTAKKSDNSTWTITVSGSYAYVGIRSKSGACYLDSVEITWD